MRTILLAITISAATIGISFYTGYKAGKETVIASVSSVVSKSIESNTHTAVLHNSALSVITDNLAGDLLNVDKNTSDIISGINAGHVRLSVNTVCPSTTATAGPTASRNNGISRSQLSKQDAKFFTELAGEADKVALRLQACQKGYKSLWDRYEAMRTARD